MKRGALVLAMAALGAWWWSDHGQPGAINAAVGLGIVAVLGFIVGLSE